MIEEDYFQLYYEFKEMLVPMIDTSRALVNHLCEGCQHTFACDSIEVCKLTNNLKKVLEDYK